MEIEKGALRHYRSLLVDTATEVTGTVFEVEANI